MSQTTNPKLAAQPWNKPKGSTYARFAGAMFLDGESHVQWTGLSEYTDYAESKEWLDVFSDGVPQAYQGIAYQWLSMKLLYETKRDNESRWAKLRETAMTLGVDLKVSRGQFKVIRNANDPSDFIMCGDSLDRVDAAFHTLMTGTTKKDNGCGFTSKES